MGQFTLYCRLCGCPLSQPLQGEPKIETKWMIEVIYLKDKVPGEKVYTMTDYGKILYEGKEVARVEQKDVLHKSCWLVCGIPTSVSNPLEIDGVTGEQVPNIKDYCNTEELDEEEKKKAEATFFIFEDPLTNAKNKQRILDNFKDKSRRVSLTIKTTLTNSEIKALLAKHGQLLSLYELKH